MGVGAVILGVLGAWQLRHASALDLGPSINPFSGNKQYIIRIVEQFTFFDDVPSDRRTMYRDAEGQDFTCLLPPTSTAEAQSDNLALYTDGITANPAAIVQELLEGIAGNCVRQKEGWWIFEVCVGIHVRQYHTTNGVLDEEYMMGRFNETEQDYNLKGSEEGPKHAVQIYSNGQICDLTGKERRVDVRFICSEDGIHIRAIEEIVSCQYVIVIGTPVICSEELGTVPGGRQKIRLNEVLCKLEQESRTSRTVIEQAIASSLAGARQRGEPNIPEHSLHSSDAPPSHSHSDKTEGTDGSVDQEIRVEL